MSEFFADYIPQAWFDEAGLRRTRRLIVRTSATAVKRMRRWRHSAKDLSVAIVVSAAVAASVAVSDTATASNVLDLPIPPGVVTVAPPPLEGASIGDVNKSFDQLFEAFRTGTKMVTNERTRELAGKAASRRNERPQGWAHKLASDVGDAHD